MLETGGVGLLATVGRACTSSKVIASSVAESTTAAHFSHA